MTTIPVDPGDSASAVGSSITPASEVSAVASATSGPAHGKGKQTSPVWQFFTRVLLNGEEKAECMVKGCKARYSLKGGGTGSLLKHMQSAHTAIWKAAKSGMQGSGPLDKFTKKNTSAGPASLEDLKTRLVHWVVLDQQSFRVTENEYFRRSGRHLWANHDRRILTSYQQQVTFAWA